MFGFGGRVI